MEKVRINKYLSEQGLFSRRKADEYVGLKRVKVNGSLAEPGQKVDPLKDQITIDGKTFIHRTSKKIYYALFKPEGVVSTLSDEKNRPVITDLVPTNPRVYPVGRLDLDTSGLIILTNDGELTKLLTHPSAKIEKEYEVLCKTLKPEFDYRKINSLFCRGLYIDGKVMKADHVELKIGKEPDTIILTLILHTGYNRQIRRMCDKIGLKVVSLRRTRINNLTLEGLGLKPKEYKLIKKEDII